ncbi:MAG: Serine/threonine protein kinase [Nocardioides sp.]|nr:Serine/threonine protein kinase [Nocardioides sp.]
MSSQPITIAGRFDVERAVGRGGMGTVWLCRDTRLGRQVAVKQVGRLPGESSTHLARALREARSSAMLNHPHVVAVYDAVEEGDHAWLVMEYVPSRTLAEMVAAEGPLPPEQVAWFGAQAADGLAAAHAAGIVHRDVKPSNVLVTDEGLVKITDFGIARTHGQEAITRTGIVLGTPSYFAPELARGLEPQPSADVWALGATLFMAVEGQAPYAEQDNALALLARIASEEPPTPTQAGFLTEPITRMMDPDPAHRWSMADAERVLRRLHQQHPMADGAGPGTASRNSFAAPLPVVDDPSPATAQIPLADLDPTPAPTPAPVPVAAPAPDQDDRGRRRGVLLVLAAVLLLVALAGGAFALLGGDDDDPETASDGATTQRSAATTPSPRASSSPPEETEDPVVPVEPTETEEEPEPTEEPTETEEAPVAGDPAEFASGYYSLLPGDTASAYSLLSPDYQARTSQSSYAGFWNTVEGVTVRGTEVVNETTVDVLLTYSTANGSEDETRRLYLEPAGDGWVIADDEAV